MRDGTLPARRHSRRIFRCPNCLFDSINPPTQCNLLPTSHRTRLLGGGRRLGTWQFGWEWLLTMTLLSSTCISCRSLALSALEIFLVCELRQVTLFQAKHFSFLSFSWVTGDFLLIVSQIIFLFFFYFLLILPGEGIFRKICFLIRHFFKKYGHGGVQSCRYTTEGSLE